MSLAGSAETEAPDTDGGAKTAQTRINTADKRTVFFISHISPIKPRCRYWILLLGFKYLPVK
jgi:hypothetical protein